jgi:hypothetical protein
MSALVPGLGLAYLRQWLRAVYWFGLAVLAGSTGLPESLVTAVGATQRTASAVVVGLVVVASVVDTYRTALFAGDSAADDGPTARCESCGRSVDEDLAFCHWCGEPFGDANWDGGTADGGGAKGHE